MQTTVRCLRIDRRRISYVKFILEAYDNVAVLSTLDARQGLVTVTVAPGCADLVDGILESLAESCNIATPSSIGDEARVPTEGKHTVP